MDVLAKLGVRGKRNPVPPDTVGVLDFHTVTTMHGGTLALDRERQRICAVDDRTEPSRHSRLVLCVPKANRHIGLFIAVENPLDQITIEGKAGTGAIIVVRIFRIPGASVVSFRDPSVGRFVCATGELDDAGRSRVAIGTVTIGPGEHFALRQIAYHEFGRTHEALLSPLGSLLKAPLTVANVLLGLRQATSAGDVRHLAAMATLLPLSEIALLGRALLNETEIINRLALAFPDDIWLSQALPALAKWAADRDTPCPRRSLLTPENDFLAGLPFTPLPSFGLLCTAGARRSIPPRRNVCILATAATKGATSWSGSLITARSAWRRFSSTATAVTMAPTSCLVRWPIAAPSPGLTAKSAKEGTLRARPMLTP